MNSVEAMITGAITEVLKAFGIASRGVGAGSNPIKAGPAPDAPRRSLDGLPIHVVDAAAPAFDAKRLATGDDIAALENKPDRGLAGERGPPAGRTFGERSMKSEEAKKLMPEPYASYYAEGLSLGKERAEAIGRCNDDEWIEDYAETYATAVVEGRLAAVTRLSTILLSPVIDLDGDGDLWRVALKLAADAPELSAETIIDIIGQHTAKPEPATIGSRNTQNVAVLLGHGLTAQDGDAWNAIAASVNRQFGIAPTKQ